MSGQVFLSQVGDELFLRKDSSQGSEPADGGHLHVIGDGIIGLTVAWALLDAGYNVSVISEGTGRLDKGKTAIWEYPSEPSTSAFKCAPVSDSQRWAQASYRVLDSLAGSVPITEHGVQMTMTNYLFQENIFSSIEDLERMAELERVREIRGFCHDPTLCMTLPVNSKTTFVESYRHLAPVVDEDRYISWLRKTVKARGANFLARSDLEWLTRLEGQLMEEYAADAIINTVGSMRTRKSSNFDSQPLGQTTFHALNDGSQFPILREAVVTQQYMPEGQKVDIKIVPDYDGLVHVELVHPFHFDDDRSGTLRDVVNQAVAGLGDALEEDFLNSGSDLTPISNIYSVQQRQDGDESSRIIDCVHYGPSNLSHSFGMAADVLALAHELTAEIAREPKRLFRASL